MTDRSAAEPRYAICIRNDGCPASLEIRKIYELLPDEEASRHNHVRAIDESGEDYLFPADYFVPISLPEAAEHAFKAAS